MKRIIKYCNNVELSASDDVAVLVSPGVAPEAPVLQLSQGQPLQLRITTAAGQSYTIQSAPALEGASWETVRTLPAGAGGVVTVPLEASGELRFYRAVTPAL